MIGAAAGARARWLVAGAALAFVVVAALVGSLMALLGASLPCVGGGGGSASFAAGPADRAVHRDFPPARIALFQAAGRRFDIDWTFVASIAYQECGAGVGCVGANPSGCAGPMEIAAVRDSACSPGPGPTLWERYGLDIDGDGVANVNDPVDAIFSAAHIMRVVMHAPPAGGSYAGYRQAACEYYGACADSIVAYANEVMARALEYGFGVEAAQPQGAGREVVVSSGSGSSCGGSGGSGGGALGQEIVRIADSQLGQGEQPPGSNCTRYGPCEEWCSLFVAWVWERAGVPLQGGTAPYAYSGSIYEWAAAHEERPRLGHEGAAPGEAPFSTPEPDGARVLPPSATPAPGDAVLYGSGPTASDHVGIVERVFPDGEITTIDGNYGDRVSRVGPFFPSQAASSGEPAPIFGYAHPAGSPAKAVRGGA